MGQCENLAELLAVQLSEQIETESSFLRRGYIEQIANTLHREAGAMSTTELVRAAGCRITPVPTLPEGAAVALTPEGMILVRPSEMREPIHLAVAHALARWLLRSTDHGAADVALLTLAIALPLALAQQMEPHGSRALQSIAQDHLLPLRAVALRREMVAAL
jgi:hypothetical protein